MATETLLPGYKALALQLQEAAMAHGDVRNQLQSAVSAATSSGYGYYVDHTGDGESGDCIYTSNGSMQKAPYEIATVGDKKSANLDTANAVKVMPSTTYDEQADDDDQYTSMSEAFKAAKIYTELPLYERFISKGERSGASDDSFAGKGKSFPILKAADVTAAIHAMGRAGSDNYGVAQLKANIIRISKAKGFTSELPKNWQGDTKEARLPNEGGLRLVESANTLETFVLKEAKADYEIKLIAPGKGSSAFYPAEVLKRDGPKVFKAGTKVYVNHQTAAEETARPEGDVKNLAGVLTTNAVYHENHAKGPGLYGRMKVFADHGQMVEEKAAHVGMSIRASGIAESKKQHEGLPILKEFTSAQSVDIVTEAGAGGMIFVEAARPADQEEVSEMDAAELKTLRESVDAQKQVNAQLLARAIRGDAREAAETLLESVSLPKEAKARVITEALKDIPQKDGAIDSVKFAESVGAIAKREGEYLAAVTGSGKVTNMGTPSPIQQVLTETVKPEDIAARSVKTFMRLGLSEGAAKAAVQGRA